MDNSAQVQIDKALSSPRRRFNKVVVGLVAASPLLANAAIDVSEITTLLGEGVVAAAVIGLGFLGFKAGIAIFKNLRSAT